MTDLKASYAEQRGLPAPTPPPSRTPCAYARTALVTGMHGALIVRCLKEH
jgi:hypothetical protein